MFKLKLTVFLIVVFSHFSLFSDAILKDDEDVWFFPTSASQIQENVWNFPIHHWVFEKEEKSIGRRITQKVLSEVIEGLGVTEEQASSPLVRQRLMWFLVDNQRKKEIEVILSGGGVLTLSPTAPNGHANTNINYTIPANLFSAGDWLKYEVIDPNKARAKFTGSVQLIPEEGLSVISDVDDTIKISDVLDKKELIKNTFVKAYQITEGFPKYYRKLEAEGAYFHYVSASPWQIQPSLKGFMDKHYPRGTIALRNFRLKDSSLFAFLQSSAKYKVQQIKYIIQRYPKHQFILIGDSGEHDPEVYAKIYRQFPRNIKSIIIRAVEGSDLTEKRFSETFQAIPQSIWKVVTKP